MISMIKCDIVMKSQNLHQNCFLCPGYQQYEQHLGIDEKQVKGETMTDVMSKVFV